jgi:hypothetical protein
MADVVMDPDFLAKVEAAGLTFMDERLGPSIANEARILAPIGVSVPPTPRVPIPHEAGELKASIGHHMEGTDLIVEAAAPYAAYVELGTFPHPIDSKGDWSLHNPVNNRYFGQHVRAQFNTPRPYLRPALYRYRAE